MDQGRVRAVLAGALLCAVVMSGCAGQGAPVDVAAPAWQSGYTWSYLISGDERGTFQDGDEEERFNETFERRMIRSVHNTTTRIEGEPVYVSVVRDIRDDEQFDRVEVLRQADLAYIPAWLDYDYECGATCRPLDAELIVFGDMPEPFLQFPLHTGDTWNQVLNEGEDMDDDFPPVALAFKVAGAALVDTPIGSLKAARIDIQATTVLQDEWRRMVREEASQDGYEVAELDARLHEQAALYYSEDYQSVVRSDVRGEFRLMASGTDGDGEPFHFAQDVRYEYHTIIDGARFAPRPEADLLQISQSIIDGTGVQDPAGEVVETVTYSVGLDRQLVDVNAFGDGRAAFEARVDGEMPDHHVLLWQVLDGRGRQVEDGTGTSFSFDPTDPGVYQIRLTALAGNQEISSTSARVQAHWLQELTLDCGPVGVNAPACPEVDVPVHDGVGHVRVVATPEGGVGQLQSLRVYDAEGSAIFSEQEGGSHVVDEEEPYDHVVNQEPWRAAFVRGVSALQEVHLEIQVLYGDAGEAPAVVEPAGSAPGTPAVRPHWPWA